MKYKINPRLEKYPPSALRSYCDLMLGIPGHTLASARRDIEEALERKIPSNQMYAWLTGRVETPKQIRDYCRQAAIERLADNAGLMSKKEIDWDSLANNVS